MDAEQFRVFLFFHKFMHGKTTKITSKKDKKRELELRVFWYFHPQFFCDYHWVQGCICNLLLFLFLFSETLQALHAAAPVVFHTRTFQAARAASLGVFCCVSQCATMSSTSWCNTCGFSIVGESLIFYFFLPFLSPASGNYSKSFMFLMVLVQSLFF